MKNRYLYLLIFGLLMCCPVVAQTQLEMNQDAQAEYVKADAELNRTYKQLVVLLDKKEKQLLVKAQKNWILFRDTHCRFEISTYEGGSIQPLIWSNCLTECTNVRIADLKAAIEERKH